MPSRSDIVLFTGPTLGADAAQSRLDAHCLPPVRYGDVYRAVTLLQPRIIGIVDGYFNQVPAVWHKEILWAMERGVLVYGAASMGALRAAELDSFGMRGVGAIYRAYQVGQFQPYSDPFEDDDEVAVIHGPAELGFPPASEAMVNIRATLASAAQEQIISDKTRDTLVRRAKILFYADRSFEQLLAAEPGEEISAEELTTLRQWLPKGRIDQKRQDALTLLRELRSDANQQNSEGPTKYRFEHTTLWEHAIREMSQIPVIDSPALEELQLLGEDFFALQDNLLVDAFGESTNPAVTPENSSTSETWYQTAMRDRAIAIYKREVPTHWLMQRMLDLLAENEELEPLERRAADKREKLAGRKLPHAADLSELEKLQLLDWYFSQFLQQDIPDDIEAYAAQLGDLQADEFLNLVLREYFYQNPET